MKPFHPSAETSLLNAIFRWYDIRAEERDSHHEIQDVVQQRAYNANRSTHGMVNNKSD
jgi:hypothetical protein